MAIRWHIANSAQALGTRWEDGIGPLVVGVMFFDEVIILGPFDPEHSACMLPVFNILDARNEFSFDVVAFPRFKLVLLLLADILFAALK